MTETVLRSLAGGAIFADVPRAGATDVVALHGWRRDRRDFAALQQRLPVAAFDLPGFGSAAPPPAAWGAQEYAACVATAVEELGNAGPKVLVGHSFGGRVATCLAAERPELVAGLVLCGVPLVRLAEPSKPPIAYRAARLANRLHLLSDEKMEARRRSSGSADYRAATGVMRDVLVRLVNETYEAQLERVRAPVVLLWGADDTTAPPAIAERAAGHLHGRTSVEILEGIGHDVHRDAPDAVVAAVRQVQGAAAT